MTVTDWHINGPDEDKPAAGRLVLIKYRNWGTGHFGNQYLSEVLWFWDQDERKWLTGARIVNFATHEDQYVTAWSYADNWELPR